MADRHLDTFVVAVTVGFRQAHTRPKTTRCAVHLRWRQARSGKLTAVTTFEMWQQDNSVERVVSHTIGVGRILWGATTAIASRRVYNALGISYPSSDLGVWIKAFGVRDIVLGAAALHPDATVRRANLRAGIAMDLIDAVVVADAARRGLPRKAALVGIALAGGTAAFAAFGPGLINASRTQ
ncbi:hypothetical protein [Rhodococcus artemisiae]|uniref:DUF4267 domain-containing protein n=1 Tax=Rhodococcus artemisiae TaxID=714159 RepID=A0ABU7LEL4_9NOCA|nr:hypothetical protein [Rhodococcus artemisiae]MEE2060002.1 hypothetical protein [Rhodococcus artemisiae]